MVDALHRADVEEKLTAVEHGDTVSFDYRSYRSDTIRAKSGRVVDAYSPMPAAATIVVRGAGKMYEIKPDGVVRSQDVGDLGTLTRLTIT